jgi:hypothetical protein
MDRFHRERVAQDKGDAFLLAEVRQPLPVVLNEEHSAFAWLHPVEAVSRLPLPSQRAALRRICEHFVVQPPEETLRIF